MCDGLNVIFNDNFLSKDDTSDLFSEFVSAPFIQPTFKICGRTCKPRRAMLAYGDLGLSYTFCATEFRANPWTPSLLKLKSAVESACGEFFNFVLINLYEDGNSKIAAHKDDEHDLCENASIACVSVGATRTLLFKRKGFPIKKFILNEGSLYVMKPPTNKYWTHQIDAEPKVKEMRISFTFRNIIAQEDPTIRPAKRICRESTESHPSSSNLKEIFKKASTSNFFKEPTDIDSSNELIANIHQNCGDISSESLSNVYAVQVDTTTAQNSETNIIIYKKHVHSNIILSAELYQGIVIIHIRLVEDADDLIPTRSGICFPLETYREFFCKFLDFNFHYKSSSFIANNSVIALNLENRLLISKLNSKQKIILNPQQKLNLHSLLYEMNEEIIEFLLCKHLIVLIEKERRLMAVLSEAEEENLFHKLISCIEEQLSSLFYFNYPCEGCKVSHPSQRRHECLTVSNRNKFDFLGRDILLLINVNEIVKTFVNSVDFISQHFVEKISVEMICKMLFGGSE